MHSSILGSALPPQRFWPDPQAWQPRHHEPHSSAKKGEIKKRKKKKKGAGRKQMKTDRQTKPKTNSKDKDKQTATATIKNQ